MESNEIFGKLMQLSASEIKEKTPNESSKKMKPSEKLLKTIESFGFNMDQLDGVLKVKGNQLIVSCAGSGKTTALVFKIIYNIVTGEATRVVEVNGNALRVPDKIFVSTFLRTGAEELERKMSIWLGRLGVGDFSRSVTFSTLHAEFKRVLNQVGVETNIVSAVDNSKYLKEVVNSYALKNSDGRPLNAENLKDLESALARTRNMISKERYMCDTYNEFGMGVKVIDSVLRDWKFKRSENGFMDFEDLQEMLFDQCCVRKNEKLISFLADRYNYLYIDEFQDISEIQYEILKVYASGCRKIVAIGDDDQTIYSWRGSCNEIITKRFSKDFSPTVSELSLNYRCPENILKAVVPSIEKNEGRFSKSLRAARKGGELRVGRYATYRGMVSSLGELIEKDVESGMSVAVLCRTNSDGLMPALILDTMGRFQFSISNDGMTLDSYVGRLILGIARMFTESYSGRVEQALSLLTWDKYSVSKLLKVCKNNKMSFWDLSEEDLAYSCPDIYGTLKEWRTVRKSEGDIKALNLVLDHYRTEIFRKDNQFNRVCKSVISSMQALITFNSYESVPDFLDDIEAINERLKARKKNYAGTRIKIVTVHEFKGKEADSVYVWNDSKKIFPYSKSANSGEDYEEERRIHYIACTRARKRSTLMYILGEPGDFVQEMDLKDAVKIEDTKGVTARLGGKVSDEERNLKKLEELSRNNVKGNEVKKSSDENEDVFDDVIVLPPIEKKEEVVSGKVPGLIDPEKVVIGEGVRKSLLDDWDRDLVECVRDFIRNNLSFESLYEWLEENQYDEVGYSELKELYDFLVKMESESKR